MWYMHANMRVHTDKLMHIIIIKKNSNSLETTGAREAFWMAAVRFGSLSTRHIYCLGLVQSTPLAPMTLDLLLFVGGWLFLGDSG